MEVFLYKLYGYGLCKGVSPPTKIAENNVQETLHFEYLNMLVSTGSMLWRFYGRSKMSKNTALSGDLKRIEPVKSRLIITCLEFIWFVESVYFSYIIFF